MLFKKESYDPSLYKIFSFYNSKINPKFPKYQQAVFRKFGFPINHFVNEAFTHGDCLNYIFRTVTDTKYLIFFDIDCIPVNKKWLKEMLKDLSEPDTLAGAAQTANHFKDIKNIYVSSFFFGISTDYLKKLDYPDMNMEEQVETAQNLTDKIIKQGGNIKYWWPTHIEKEQWYLHHPEHDKFGPGTTYNNSVYHAFGSSYDVSDRFKKKCKSVLYGPFYKLWTLLGRT